MKVVGIYGLVNHNLMNLKLKWFLIGVIACILFLLWLSYGRIVEGGDLCKLIPDHPRCTMFPTRPFRIGLTETPTPTLIPSPTSRIVITPISETKVESPSQEKGGGGEEQGDNGQDCYFTKGGLRICE